MQDDELELDIDELSDETLRKLYNFVKKNSTRPGDTPRAKPASTPAPTAAPSRKKHKPMSKHEQERQIEQLKGNIAQFENPTPTAEDALDPCKSITSLCSFGGLKKYFNQINIQPMQMTPAQKRTIARKARRSRCRLI